MRTFVENLVENLRREILLLLLAPAHQLVDRASRVATALEDFAHLRGNRKLDAMLPTELNRRASRSDALGDHAGARDNVRDRATARQLDPDVAVAAEVARAGQHEVPEPGQPGERVALRARGPPPAAQFPPVHA